MVVPVGRAVLGPSEGKKKQKKNFKLGTKWHLFMCTNKTFITIYYIWKSWPINVTIVFCNKVKKDLSSNAFGNCVVYYKRIVAWKGAFDDQIKWLPKDVCIFCTISRRPAVWFSLLCKFSACRLQSSFCIFIASRMNKNILL